MDEATLIDTAKNGGIALVVVYLLWKVLDKLTAQLGEQFRGMREEFKGMREDMAENTKANAALNEKLVIVMERLTRIEQRQQMGSPYRGPTSGQFTDEVTPIETPPLPPGKRGDKS